MTQLFRTEGKQREVLLPRFPRGLLPLSSSSSTCYARPKGARRGEPQAQLPRFGRFGEKGLVSDDLILHFVFFFSRPP